MKEYLLSIMQPDGPAPADIGEIMQKVHAVNAELRAAGAWVFNQALTPASSATVVRSRAGDPPMTDGPYVEGKEHIGGIIVVAATDLDAALEWARKYSEATSLPIEVRPFVGHG
ncbi:MAG: YciI family protein [Polyangiaceae bacterium]